MDLSPHFARISALQTGQLDGQWGLADLVAVDGEHREAGLVEEAAEVLDFDERRNVTSKAAFALHFGELQRDPEEIFHTLDKCVSFPS